jgi:hypothetical protein
MLVNYCVVPITVLRNAPYNLRRFDLISVKFRAQNIRGWSDYSDPNNSGVTIKTEPDMMTIPINGDLTDEWRIDVSWLPMVSPENGDSAITSYDLQYDNGTGGFIWYSLIGLHPDSLALAYRITTGVVPGRYYRFRVRARNPFGWGDLSPWLEIKAATLPDTMIPPTTSIDSASGHLRISWVAPHDGSDTITKYTI